MISNEYHNTIITTLVYFMKYKRMLLQGYKMLSEKDGKRARRITRKDKWFVISSHENKENRNVGVRREGGGRKALCLELTNRQERK